MLGEYALPTDMVKALGDAEEVKPSCEAPAARRIGFAPDRLKAAAKRLGKRYLLCYHACVAARACGYRDVWEASAD